MAVVSEKDCVKLSAGRGYAIKKSGGEPFPARRLDSIRFIGEATMKTAGVAVLPGTGRKAGSSLPKDRP